MTEPQNKGMKLSKPEYLGGSRPLRSGVIQAGFAAYAQCYAHRSLIRSQNESGLSTVSGCDSTSR